VRQRLFYSIITTLEVVFSCGSLSIVMSGFANIKNPRLCVQTQALALEEIEYR
jgi:hypothetical protein